LVVVLWGPHSFSCLKHLPNTFILPAHSQKAHLPKGTEVGLFFWVGARKELRHKSDEVADAAKLKGKQSHAAQN
jgi:hypothetical protein